MTVFGGALDKQRKERLAADVHAAICAAAGIDPSEPPRLSRVDVDSRDTRGQLGGRRQRSSTTNRCRDSSLTSSVAG